MSEQPIPHCVTRAKERYGIDLSVMDVVSISRRCRAGEGRTGSNDDGSQFHIIIFGTRVLWLVYMPPGANSPHVNGTIMTIMPPGVAGVMVAMAAQHTAIRRKEYRPKKRVWR